MTLATRNIKALVYLRKVLQDAEDAAAAAINECDETRPVVDWRKIKPKVREALFVIEGAERGR